MSHTMSHMVPEMNYADMLSNALNDLINLNQKRKALNAEINKLKQFVEATLAIASVAVRDEFKDYAYEVLEALSVNTSLADSIREVFDANSEIGFSVADVRRSLAETGFDFTSYTSNPLSSISTTLRRMAASGELRSAEISGFKVYAKQAKRGKIRLLSEVRKGAAGAKQS